MISRIPLKHLDSPVVIPAAQVEEIAALLRGIAQGETPTLLQRADALLLASGLNRRLDAVLPLENRADAAPKKEFVSCPSFL